jgi:hypothetical protein
LAFKISALLFSTQYVDPKHIGCGRFSLITNSLPIIWVDAILLFTFLEWLVLSFISTKSKHGLRFADISAGLLPGWLLMLALRFAAPPELSIEVFICLSLAGIAHALDFYRRYRKISA